MQLAGRTFLITGGSSGLGAGCAQQFANAGANVVIADVNAEAGRALADQIGELARFAYTDVTDQDSVQATINLAVKGFGGLHGLVNCAGITVAALTVRRGVPHDLDTFSQVIQVNLIGTFNTIRLAAVPLIKNEPNDGGERGVIINTASVAAFDGQIGQPAYAASKGGVVGMTLPIAREMARYGIRVVTIAPGLFDTPMMAGLPEAARESLAKQVPFPSRFGQPIEYAALAQHIIENPMINGEVIRLDGAIRMASR